MSGERVVQEAVSLDTGGNSNSSAHCQSTSDLATEEHAGQVEASSRPSADSSPTRSSVAEET